jgi:ferritin-like metal-binding protein YciE
MYLVRVSMPSRNGSSFHRDFTEPTDDHQQAVHNAISALLSGLTIEEKRAARNSLDVMAHPSGPFQGAAALLQETLNEEKKADAKLTQIGEEAHIT